MENQNRRTYLDAQSILYYENLIFRYSSPELVKRAKKLKIQKAVTKIGLKIWAKTIGFLFLAFFVPLELVFGYKQIFHQNCRLIFLR